MVLMWPVFLFVILLASAEIVDKRTIPKLRPRHKITVGLSGRSSFVILNQNGAPKGLDILIIEHFARKLKFQIDYFSVNMSLSVVSSDDFNASSDQTSSRNIDIFIGALDENDLINEHYVASRPYYHDALTWCVQQQKPVPRWKSFFNMCTDPIVIVLLAFTGILVLYFAYYLQQFEDVRLRWDTIRNALGILRFIIGFYVEINPRTLAYRIFLAFSLPVILVTTTFIVSFTIKVINDPQLQHQVASIKEIVDIKNPFEMVGDRFALEHLMRQNETYPEVHKRFVICDDSSFDLYLNELNENARLAVALSREYALNIQRNMNYELYCFENSEIIHDYALKFFVRKDFPYLIELNSFLRSASAGGLIENWRLGIRIKSNYKPEYEEKVRQITKLADFSGALGLWFIMLVFVNLSLLFEKFVHKKKRSVNSSRFWIYAEMAIDPHRHFMLENRSFEN